MRIKGKQKERKVNRDWHSEESHYLRKKAQEEKSVAEKTGRPLKRKEKPRRG